MGRKEKIIEPISVNFIDALKKIADEKYISPKKQKSEDVKNNGANIKRKSTKRSR